MVATRRARARREPASATPPPIGNGLEGAYGFPSGGLAGPPHGANPATPAEQLVQAFAVFGPAYLRWVEACMRTSGLSFARARLIGLLGIRSPRKMSELSDELGVTRHNVTVLVDALERAGLVGRQPHPKDRRAILVDLTDEGRTISDESFPEGIAQVAELFGMLTEAEQRTLLRLIHTLWEELQRRGASPWTVPSGTPASPSPSPSVGRGASRPASP